MRKQVSFALALSMVMTSGMATVANAAADDGKTNVVFWNSWTGGDGDTLEALVNKFNEESDTVHVEMTRTTSFSDMLQTSLPTGEAADLVLLSTNEITRYKSYLRSMDDIWENTGLKEEDFSPAYLNMCYNDDTLYAIPFQISTYMMYYNKDLFDQAGVTYPTDDWTQDDVQNAAEKIRALGDDIFGIWQPITYNEFFKVVAQYGGSLLNEDKTQFTINSEENIKAAQTLVDRVLVSNVQPNSVQQGGMGDWDMFMSGRLGMIPTGIWAFQTFTENCDFAWDIAVEPGSTQKATHFFSNCVVMNPETEHPEEVAEWLAWLTSSTESADIRLAAGWDLPALKDLNALSSYLEITPPDNRKAVFESLDYLVMPPVIEDYALMSDIIGQYLSAAADGTMTVTDALNAAQADCEAQITLD